MEGLARVRESLERLERRHIDGRISDSYNSAFHRWIRTIFGYVVLIHVVYIFT
jgi:preprotein translocase subunit SecF